ncbi:MAG TPA: hypothetical protein VGQ87_02555 [Patescibacteria group bacterium]|jgi:hypothetical protein|nr:hypothetical protein [Patescibacteria group bacterium]
MTSLKQKHRNITISILTLAIVANLFLPVFAFGQTTISKGDFDTAQISQSNCRAFSTKLQTWSQNSTTKFSAVWDDQVANIYGNQKCFVTKTIQGYGVQTFRGGASELESIINSSTQPVAAPTPARSTSDWAVGALTAMLASPLASFIDDITGGLLILSSWSGSILSIAVQGTTGAVKSPDIVLAGWVVVRDVMNMFFILAMIVISLATILRIERYGYKKLLVKLILMALLINFSKTIAEALISVVDVLIRAVAPSNNGLISFYAESAKILNSQDDSVFKILAGIGGTATIIISITKLFLAIIMTITFVALAILFVIRMVGLWVLVIISPIAYALNILPATESYAKKWWETFIKYLIWAPVALFFLNIAGRLIVTEQLHLFTGYDTMFKFVIIMALMWASIVVAKAAGMAGSSMIISMAEKLAGKALAAPVALTWAGAKGLAGLGIRSYSGAVARKIGLYSGEGEKAAGKARFAQTRLGKLAALEAKGKALTPAQLAEKTRLTNEMNKAKEEQRVAGLKSAAWRAASFLDPHVTKEAWKERKHELEMRAYLPAVGHMRDTLNRVVPTEWMRPSRIAEGELGKKTYRGLVGERAVVAAESKEMLEGVRTREDAARLLRDAFKSKDKDEIMAALKVVQHGNWQDDYMNTQGLTHSIPRYINHITQQMKEAGFSEEETTTFLDDLKETAEANKRIRALGYTRQDNDGVVRAANDFGFYRGLDDAGLSKEFTGLSERYKLAFEETKNQEFGALADSFDDAARRAGAGEKFDSIISTDYSNRLPENQRREDMNLGDALTQRRFMDEANSKLQRGEGWSRALEAAIFVDQTTEGYDVQNLLGKMMMHELPPNTITAFTNRIHESQGRTVYGFGGFRDNQTGKWGLPDITLVNNAKTIIQAESDPEKRRLVEERIELHKISLEKAMETQLLQPKMFNAVTGSARLFTKDQRDEFKRQWNDHISTLDPRLGYKPITQTMEESRD